MAAPAFSVLRLCANRAGYEAIPQSRLALDLTDVERRAAAHGFEPLTNAGVILVLRWGTLELSVFESGKLLFKTKDEKLAAVGMRELREAMDWR